MTAEVRTLVGTFLVDLESEEVVGEGEPFEPAAVGRLGWCGRKIVERGLLGAVPLFSTRIRACQRTVVKDRQLAQMVGK